MNDSDNSDRQVRNGLNVHDRNAMRHGRKEAIDSDRDSDEFRGKVDERPFAPVEIEHSDERAEEQRDQRDRPGAAALESLKHDEQVLLRRYAQIQEKLTSGTDEHLRRLYSDSLARRDQTLGRKRAQIGQVEKAIAAAESGRIPPPGSKHEETKLEK